MARLVLEFGGERREIRVTGPVTIGRSAEATVQIDDKTLSREHTQVFLQNNRLFVRDLESKNGTYLNGSLIKGTEPLKHGDRIKVGPGLFTVVLDAAEISPTAPATRPAPATRAPASPPPAPAPSRSRAEQIREDAATGAFMILVYRAFLIGIVIVGAFLSKPIFASLLEKIPK